MFPSGRCVYITPLAEGTRQTPSTEDAALWEPECKTRWGRVPGAALGTGTQAGCGSVRDRLKCCAVLSLPLVPAHVTFPFNWLVLIRSVVGLFLLHSSTLVCPVRIAVQEGSLLASLLTA